MYNFRFYQDCSPSREGYVMHIGHPIFGLCIILEIKFYNIHVSNLLRINNCISYNISNCHYQNIIFGLK